MRDKRKEREGLRPLPEYEMNETREVPWKEGFFTLVVTERKSVAQYLAGILSAYKRKEGFFEGNGYRVIWCTGHMVELAPPEAYNPEWKVWRRKDLPIIPTQWRMVTDAKKLTQAGILIGQMNAQDVCRIVNACGFNQEGERIFRNIYEQSCSKTPVKRLWLTSMEEDCVRAGFEKLWPQSELDGMATAAQCRAKADWLLGINLTRAWSCYYGDRVLIGRTRIPVLSMICGREREILTFQAEESWALEVDTGEGLKLETEVFPDPETLESAMEGCRNNSIRITHVSQREERIPSPALYDQISLLRDANRIYGMSAKKTEERLRKLFEERLITNPDTTTTTVPHSMEAEIREMIQDLSGFGGLYGVKGDAQVFRVLRDSDDDPGLPILPTSRLTVAAMKECTKEEQNLLRLILLRLVESTSLDHVRSVKEVEAVCGVDTIRATIYAETTPGFLAPRRQFQSQLVPTCLEAGPLMMETEIFNNIKENKTYAVKQVHPVLYRSAVPDRYTEDALMSVIDPPNIVPDAVERLIKDGFLVREGTALRPTLIGQELDEKAPKEMKDLALTRRLEEQLQSVEKGTKTEEDFLKEVQTMVEQMVEEVRQKEEAMQTEKVSPGNCPVCGSPVTEGQKTYHCSDPECKFVLWKDNRLLEAVGKDLTFELVKDLLENGESFLPDCWSKKKKKRFDATLHLSVTEEGKAQYDLSFPNQNEGREDE